MNILKKEKRIYLSGQITGMKNNNADAFQKAEERLKTNKVEIINPLNLNHSSCRKWSDYMKIDIKALMGCDAIYMLKGHELSAGSNVELALAKILDIEVIYEANS